MNTKQLQYAVVLASVRNFTLAAQEVGVSQPAFSKQIIALENDLGIKLFDRTTTPLSLTAAGEYYVGKAKEILGQQEQLLKTIEDFKSGERGKLSIGIVPFRSLYVMPELVEAVKNRFPGVKITLHEHGLGELQKGLAEGLYDFAIMNLPVDDSIFDIIPLDKDSLMLAVPEKMVHLIDSQELTGKINIEDCKKLPFVVVGQNQEMRKLFDKLCLKAGIEPEIYVEVTGITTAREMVRKGLAATLLPGQFMGGEAENASVRLFEINQNEYVRQPAVVTIRGQYISKYAEYAIKVLRENNKNAE